MHNIYITSLSLYTCTTQNQISEARSELATLQQQQNQIEENSTSEKEKTMCEVADEKKRVERRLKRLIRRCDLYVKRHQILREMGIKM